MPDLRALVRQAIEDRRDGFLEGDAELVERIMEIFGGEDEERDEAHADPS